MNLDMTQFGATQNQKLAQARTLLWGKYLADRPFYDNENDRDKSRFSWLKKNNGR